MIKSEYPEASLTLSHEVANHGLLARENSSILNECLKPLSKTAIAGFTQAIKDAGLKCPVFFTQNDGTIIRYILADNIQGYISFEESCIMIRWRAARKNPYSDRGP